MVSAVWFYGFIPCKWDLFLLATILPEKSLKNPGVSHPFLDFGQRNGLLGFVFGDVFLQNPKPLPESITYTIFLWPGNLSEVSRKTCFDMFWLSLWLSKEGTRTWNSKKRSEMIHFGMFFRTDPLKKTSLKEKSKCFFHLRKAEKSWRQHEAMHDPNKF